MLKKSIIAVFTMALCVSLAVDGGVGAFSNSSVAFAEESNGVFLSASSEMIYCTPHLSIKSENSTERSN